MRKQLVLAILTIGSISPLADAQNRPTRPLQGSFSSLNERERQDVKEWIRDKMPNLATLAFNESPRQRRFAPIAWNHYRTFMNSLFQPVNGIVVRDRLLTTYKAEDQIYGLILEFDKAAPEAQQVIRGSVKAAVRKLVESNFNERAMRIEKLKRDLMEEEQRLSADRSNIDQIVAKRMNNQFISESTPGTSPSTRPSMEKSMGAPDNSLAAPVP